MSTTTYFPDMHQGQTSNAEYFPTMTEYPPPMNQNQVSTATYFPSMHQDQASNAAYLPIMAEYPPPLNQNQLSTATYFPSMHQGQASDAAYFPAMPAYPPPTNQNQVSTAATMNRRESIDTVPNLPYMQAGDAPIWYEEGLVAAHCPAHAAHWYLPTADGRYGVFLSNAERGMSPFSLYECNATYWPKPRPTPTPPRVESQVTIDLTGDGDLLTPVDDELPPPQVHAAVQQLSSVPSPNPAQTPATPDNSDTAANSQKCKRAAAEDEPQTPSKSSKRRRNSSPPVRAGKKKQGKWAEAKTSIVQKKDIYDRVRGEVGLAKVNKWAAMIPAVENTAAEIPAGASKSKGKNGARKRRASKPSTQNTASDFLSNDLDAVFNQTLKDHTASDSLANDLDAVFNQTLKGQGSKTPLNVADDNNDTQTNEAGSPDSVAGIEGGWAEVDQDEIDSWFKEGESAADTEATLVADPDKGKDGVAEIEDGWDEVNEDDIDAWFENNKNEEPVNESTVLDHSPDVTGEEQLGEWDPRKDQSWKDAFSHDDNEDGVCESGELEFVWKP